MPTDFFPDHSEEIEASIAFHFEDVTPPSFNLDVFPAWIKSVILTHQASLGQLQYVFCSDNYLHQINVDYLGHDTFTDIITFPYADPPSVHGDLYISTERVTENAEERGISYEQEFKRVMIHGVLHLIGYGDKSPAEAIKMRALEEEALNLF